MARPSTAALDVMEHIASAMDVLDHVLIAAAERPDDPGVREEVVRACEELRHAKQQGAEVVLELLNLAERHELLQGELDALRKQTLH